MNLFCIPRLLQTYQRSPWFLKYSFVCLSVQLPCLFRPLLEKFLPSPLRPLPLKKEACKKLRLFQDKISPLPPMTGQKTGGIVHRPRGVLVGNPKIGRWKMWRVGDVTSDKGLCARNDAMERVFLSHEIYFPRFHQIPLDFLRSLQIPCPGNPWDSLRFPQMFSDCLRFPQISSDSLRFSQTSSDSLRFLDDSWECDVSWHSWDSDRYIRTQNELCLLE